jgi:FkbM family methyltransferase
MDVLLATQKHPDLIYDVGMHKGEDTWFYLQKGFRVVGFEANPDLVQHCRERFRDFICQGQLTVVEGAIVSPGSVNGGPQKVPQKVQFYRNADRSVWGTVVAGWAERNTRLGAPSQVIETDAVDFVSTVQRHGVPHYLKVDIEGLDLVCVAALRRFRERPDYISIESDKTSFAAIRREINTLAELGYDSFQAVEQSAIQCSQSPPSPPREGSYVAHRFEDGCSGLFGAELDGEWKSKGQILSQYRVIRLGYYLVGDDGILNGLQLPGTWRLRSLAVRSLGPLTKEAVPVWYDTHARHSSVGAAPGLAVAGVSANKALHLSGPALLFSETSRSLQPAPASERSRYRKERRRVSEGWEAQAVS